jgi:hypothetical protein
MGQQFGIGVGGVWKPANPFVGVGGVWKPVQSGWVGVAGVWRQFYSGLTATLPSSAAWGPVYLGSDPKTGAPIVDHYSTSVTATVSGGTAPFTYDFHTGSSYTSSSSWTYDSADGSPLDVSCSVKDANGVVTETNVCHIS